MKPETSLPQISPENSANQYQPNIEKAPQLNNPESGLESSSENSSRRAESDMTVGDVGMIMALPTPITITPTDDNLTTNISSYPLIANDDDLIEKEWVDRAKKILAETKDDPYLREKEVSKMQVDYIKKRYGRELGIAE